MAEVSGDCRSDRGADWLRPLLKRANRGPGRDRSESDAATDTAPVTVDQTKTVAEDGSVGVTLAATDFNINNTFTFTVVDQPLHGSVLCTAANCTYSPDAHYFGSDSFTFKANDSALDSNVSTVSITVTEINNDPSAVNDNKETAEDSSLNFPSSDLTSNDSAGPGEAHRHSRLIPLFLLSTHTA